MALTFNQAMKYTIPVDNWIIEHKILGTKSKMIAWGNEKSFKSMLISIDLAINLAQGTDWIGFRTKKSRVLIINAELPEEELAERIQDYGKAHGLSELSGVYWETTFLKLDRSTDANNLEQLVKKYKPDVLILDCLYALAQGDITRNTTITSVILCLDKLIREYGISIILVHHTSKQTFDIFGKPVQRGADASYGSAFLQYWLDSGIGLNRHDKSTNDLIVSFDDLRRTKRPIAPMHLTFNEDRMLFLPKKDIIVPLE